mmetsp:Transcript_39315/g.121560  ORF Transcript_39315/g.121560 Transcript_39315/m.121560 type:complete len:236 (+) Transcript_39315:527-1234(+)
MRRRADEHRREADRQRPRVRRRVRLCLRRRVPTRAGEGARRVQLGHARRERPRARVHVARRAADARRGDRVPRDQGADVRGLEDGRSVGGQLAAVQERADAPRRCPRAAEADLARRRDPRDGRPTGVARASFRADRRERRRVPRRGYVGQERPGGGALVAERGVAARRGGDVEGVQHPVRLPRARLQRRRVDVPARARHAAYSAARCRQPYECGRDPLGVTSTGPKLLSARSHCM